MTPEQAELLWKLRDTETGERIPIWRDAEHKAWTIGWITGAGGYYFITPAGLAALASHEGDGT